MKLTGYTLEDELRYEWSSMGYKHTKSLFNLLYWLEVTKAPRKSQDVGFMIDKYLARVGKGLGI